ncbi:hypothetical protein FB446DRAFT_647439, partial [Lentinula raphanica]
MPPHPPLRDENGEFYPESVQQWKMKMNDDHKVLGEHLQRHVCGAVCIKGRKPGSSCRFGYPHDIVEESSFDKQSNSITLKRLEKDINGHNPFVLVQTRHNHDLKCILSGRACKAAMFYISDYITKMPLKTDQLLSIL